ncbi:MAG: hypothetical protein AAF687_08860 [Pseudomonadota bacterium]
MSQQLTLSSLFSMLALGSLCAVVTLGDIVGVDVVGSQPLVQTQAQVMDQQAERTLSLPF